MKYLLATDLDGTFLGGDDDQKQYLYKLLKDDDQCILVFVTGRGVGTVEPLFQDSRFPVPQYIISDVGATIVRGNTLQPISAITEEIEKIWPGEVEIETQFSKVYGLKKQDVPMQRRSSYFYSTSTDIASINQIADDLNVDVLLSAGKFLDILPKNVNKGTTLMKLVAMLGLEAEQVIVAGDTMNDLSLFNTGYKGIVVGGAEEKLLQQTNGKPGIYHALHKGTGGILEGLRHFKIL